MLQRIGFMARLLAVVIMLGFYAVAIAATDVNDPNKGDPNKPQKMSAHKNGMHYLNCGDANDPNKSQHK
jgi:hypothetical protein